MLVNDSLWHSARSIPLESDDLTQYLDQLLAMTVPRHTPSPKAGHAKGGLTRFKSAVRKTREMVSLVAKAKDLKIDSEKRSFSRTSLSEPLFPCQA